MEAIRLHRRRVPRLLTAVRAGFGWPVRRWNIARAPEFPRNKLAGKIQRGTHMTTRGAKSTAAEEIAAIEDLMSDLEKRLRRLSGTARSEAAGASGDVRDFVGDTLSRIMERVRASASEVTHSAADEATRLGGDALKRLGEEIEHRPFIMLALAAGLGYLAGLANRR
jgi:hypothetical protein